jgi:hypothetical protein
VTAIFLGLGLSVYRVGVRWGRDRWLAALGALLAITAPYTLRTVFVEGNFPRGLALLTFPWIFWYTERVLTEKHIARVFGWLAGLWALAITAHVMQAVMLAVLLAVYVVYRALDNVYIPLRRSLLALVPVGLGAVLSAAYLIPAYSHAELSNVPYLPAEKIDIFSITLQALNPNQANIEAISLGIAGALLALVLTLRTTAEHHKALLLTGIVGIILAFGPSGGVFRLLPLHEQFLPERFLNVSMVALPLIIATTRRGAVRHSWIVIGVVVVLLIDARPAWRAVHMRAMPPDEQAIAEALADQPLPGRVANLTYPNPNASQLFLNSEVGEHANISGWALENTPHHPAIRRLLTAGRQAPAYVARVLALWNTDYVVARFESVGDAGVMRAELGFQTVAQADHLTLWERAAPSALVQQLLDNRMLIIGDNATTWLFAFPFATEGSSPDPAAYDPDYLAHFSVIGLTRLPDNTDIEGALGDWVRAGGTLIMDLSGMGRTYDEGYSVFGVHALPFSINGMVPAHWPAGLDDLPERLSFGEGWTGATYYGLDETVASLTYDGEEYVLVGRQPVGEGQAYFVGFNLFYLFQEMQQPAARDRLAGYLLARTGVDRELALPPLAVNLVEREPTAFAFTYNHEAPVSAVLSMTYFPRWQATLDGQPLDLHDHEHLMLLDLPAGTHTVRLHYAPFSTLVPIAGWAVTGVSVGLTLAAVYALKRHPLLATEDRVGAFSDRLPPLEPSLRVEHAVCPVCQFKLAISGPPNEHSYPFNAIECPICGFSLGSPAASSSGSLENPAVRRRLVRGWMSRLSLTEADLVARYNLTVDDLFDLPDTSPSPAETDAYRRLAWVADANEPGYHTCPNCGFRAAFDDDAVRTGQKCPICDTSAQPISLIPPIALPPDTRRLLVEVWLRRVDLDETRLEARFGLRFDDLIDPHAPTDTDQA